MELKICCAIMNKYGTPFIPNKDHTDEIVNRIKLRLDIPHQLLNLIEENGFFRRRTNFRPFDPLVEKMLDPPFTSTQLYLIATGSYLVKYINAYKAACREAKLERRVSH